MGGGVMSNIIIKDNTWGEDKGRGILIRGPNQVVVRGNRVIVTVEVDFNTFEGGYGWALEPSGDPVVGIGDEVRLVDPDDGTTMPGVLVATKGDWWQVWIDEGFFEDDEPIEDIRAAWEDGEKGFTSPPTDDGE